MLYDRLMGNIQNRRKRIKQMNSFIHARLQRKLRKFAENSLTFRVPGLRSRIPLLGSRVSDLGSTSELGPGLESQVPPLGSWVSSPGPIYELGPGFRVSGPTNSPGSQVPLFRYASDNGMFRT